MTKGIRTAKVCVNIKVIKLWSILNDIPRSKTKYVLFMIYICIYHIIRYYIIYIKSKRPQHEQRIANSTTTINTTTTTTISVSFFRVVEGYGVLLLI